ncbi:MAG: L-ribulose-5-phosphate 3-epimerase, partial [Spirochaetota bacterium]
MASSLFKKRRIGLYEKALPDLATVGDFQQALSTAKEVGFDYLEISIDESELRLERLNWSHNEWRELRRITEEQDFPLHSMCLSAHRRFPFGSKDPQVRKRAQEIMRRAIERAYYLGIRIIQLAGYDVYYEPRDEETQQFFLDGLRQACDMAEKTGVTLAIEIMDTEYLNSILKYREIAQQIQSPFLKVYPDLGNLFAWNNDLEANLSAGMSEIVAIHLKDAITVGDGFPGKFRDLTIGEGEVD